MTDDSRRVDYFTAQRFAYVYDEGGWRPTEELESIALAQEWAAAETKHEERNR